MSKSMYHLSEEFTRMLTIANLGCDEETGEFFDDETLDEFFRQLECDAEAKVLGTAQVMRRLKMESDDLRAEGNRLLDMANRRDKMRDRLADLLRDFMGLFKLQKVKDAFLSVSIGKPSTKVEIFNEEEIPEELMRVVRTPKKDEIKRLLEHDGIVPGAMLVTGKPRLTIR